MTYQTYTYLIYKGWVKFYLAYNFYAPSVVTNGK